MGILITFEGLDGSGKSTQITLLELYFQQQGIKNYIVTREPGGTDLGMAIRTLLFHHDDIKSIDPLAETMLFIADRAQHFANVVLPALSDNKIVICDRCYDSNIVYQGCIKHIGMGYVETLSLDVMQSIMPDLTILLDLPAEAAYGRRHSTGNASRFDAESLEFYQRVRQAYLKRAETDCYRIKVIDASKDIQQVHKDIMAMLMKRFPIEMRGLYEKATIGHWSSIDVSEYEDEQ